MTLLAEETPATISDLIGTWYVCQVRTKFAVVTAERLRDECGIPVIVPMVERRDNQRRWRTVPLLDNYLFSVVDSAEKWYLLRRMPRIYGELIKVKNRERFIAQLQGLLDAIQHNPQLGLTTMPAAGTAVEVTRGRFVGTRGTVIGRVKGKARIAIYVAEPGFAYELHVNSDDVEVLA